MSKNKKEIYNIPAWVLWLVGVLVVTLLWSLSWILLTSDCYNMDWEERSAFGSMFGAVSALFSGLAFVAIVITLYLQSRSIAQTRQDTKEQKFQNQFFQLLNSRSQIIDGIKKFQQIQGNTIIISGPNRIKMLYEEFENSFKNNNKTEENKETKLNKIKRVYKDFFERNRHELSHYFRNLYHIISFIDKSVIDDQDKIEYIKLFRSLLTSYEFLLLFYNGLSEYGEHKLKPLIEQYGFLNNMPDDIIDKDHKQFYNPNAFND